VNAISSYGWTPLHCAAFNGRLEVPKFLIEKGADVNAKNNYGWTPFKDSLRRRQIGSVANYLKSVGGKE